MKCPHCDTPIDEHEASRCLDAWVDFVVFGAEPRIMSNGQIVGRKFFSTDIAAAWEVVSDFTGRQYHVRVDGEDAFAYSAWSCAIYAPLRDEGDGPIGEGLDTSKDLNARMASAPLAICRAALKAVGE